MGQDRFGLGDFFCPQPLLKKKQKKKTGVPNPTLQTSGVRRPFSDGLNVDWL